jgi:branched-chain amino acid transport system permease protein
MIQRIFLGVLIIGFLIAEPDGLAALLQRVAGGLAGRARRLTSPSAR